MKTDSKNQSYSNEPIKKYLKNSSDREELLVKINELKNNPIDLSMVIGGEKIHSNNQSSVCPPADHQRVIGTAHWGSKKEIKAAIDAALNAKDNWAQTSFENRAAIFLKAADLIAGKHRHLMNAATMLGQGKNIYQAEIDCICELVDFLRFNVKFANEIFKIQPSSSAGIINKMAYRPLEGFVLAITPFNFTAIAGNLCCAPALFGNTIVWKPSENQIYSAHFLMEILREAGLPDGVINMILVEGKELGDICFSHPDFAAVHFTGSSEVFDTIWSSIAKNIKSYKSYPKIIGETGGKDFVLVHPSAKIDKVNTALIRGAFEYQGQKCSAASRAYIPSSMWENLKDQLIDSCKKIKIGQPEDFTFMNSVISKKSYDKIMTYIDHAKNSSSSEIICGGEGNDDKGYFIQPTILLCNDPYYQSMTEEIFGPILSIYVYEDEDFMDTISIIDKSSPYALTGSIFSEDQNIIETAGKLLENCAGNFYINDKPTGAVVNQQPFGGARKSGTNDKAGSMLNLLNWVSPRTIKENLNPPSNFDYPMLK